MSRVVERQEEAERRLEEAEGMLKLLPPLSNALELGNVQIIDGDDEVLVSSEEVSMRLVPKTPIFSDVGTLIPIDIWLDSSSLSLATKSSYFYYCPSNVETLGKFVKELIEQSQSNKKRFKARLSNSLAQPPQVWHFWDFLYFSTITQSTVGYGDILPNSSLIRAIVAAQVLIGYSIIVVVINVLLAS